MCYSYSRGSTWGIFSSLKTQYGEVGVLLSYNNDYIIYPLSMEYRLYMEFFVCVFFNEIVIFCKYIIYPLSMEYRLYMYLVVFLCVCFLIRSLFFVTTTVDLAWGLFILVVHFLAVLFGKKKKCS